MLAQILSCGHAARTSASMRSLPVVKAIAEDRGVTMPSFFGYMAWSAVILLPLFLIQTFVWFR
jgi:Na+/H+ antiporter NhaD/arsenite permease-like protein